MQRLDFRSNTVTLIMKDQLKRPLKFVKPSHTTLACALLATSVLSACSDGIQTGSSAGDTAAAAEVQAAITLLQPYVGVFELQDGWKGVAGDRGFISIRLTGNDGISEAVLIDFDDTDNCLPERFSEGEVVKDDFSDRVFLNDIQEFDSAELSLNGTNLNIEFIDGFDIDNDDDTEDTVSVQATRLGQGELDLGPTCS